MRVCSVPESSRTKKTTLWLLPRTLHEHLWFFFFALLCAYAQSQHQRSCKVQRITTNVPQQRTLGIRRPAYHQQRPTCRWLSPPHLLTRDLLPLSMCLHLTNRSISTQRTCLQIFIMHVIIICFPLNHTITPMNHEQYTWLVASLSYLCVKKKHRLPVPWHPKTPRIPHPYEKFAVLKCS